MQIEVNDTQIRTSERRYRRSTNVTEALAFQCAHVQKSLNLEAMIVADDAGDRWVGSGDPILCRVLSRGASDLTLGTDAAAQYRMKALQTIREDLSSDRVTTSVLRLPQSERRLHIVGIGSHIRRADAVLGTASGARRILGWNARNGGRPTQPTDGESILRQALTEAWYQLMDAGELEGESPRRRFGRVSDGCYEPVLNLLLDPVHEILQRSGVVAIAPWAAMRGSSNEVQTQPDHYVRALHFSLKEVRSGARVGRLIVEFEHRHTIWSLPSIPQVFIRWDT